MPRLSNLQIAKYTSKQNLRRDVDIFTGICIGILCDGHVNTNEIEFIASWIKENKHVAGEYPINLIANRIDEWLANGVISEDEELEMIQLLAGIGSDGETTEVEGLFCSPEPELTFEGMRYCFTGEFSQPRSMLERIAVNLGAKLVAKEVSGTTDFLVVGEKGSEHWIHKQGGTKIVKAVELREKGAKIKIIREALFVESVKELA